MSLLLTWDTRQQISKFLANTYYQKFATRQYTTNPPCVVSVTALPCEILITTLAMFTAILVHSKCKIVILELVFSSKWNNTTSQLSRCSKYRLIRGNWSRPINYDVSQVIFCAQWAVAHQCIICFHSFRLTFKLVPYIRKNKSRK